MTGIEDEEVGREGEEEEEKQTGEDGNFEYVVTDSTEPMC